MRRFSGIDVSDDRVVAIVNALPKKQKEVVLLRAEGLKMREIAAIQGVPEGTVKSRINYAKKKMKAEWKKLQMEAVDA